jgi:2-(1,2-epoxy-1,2-dihydrophenyl)acetyl-CoA isomerase
VTDLHVQIDDHVATVEIRRPPANYFDEPLVEALADTYEMLDRDYFCRAIVLCSEGKHFCAGANFTRDDQRDADDGDVARFYSQALRLFSTETPVVAAVQGAAIGGGFWLALSADFRVGGGRLTVRRQLQPAGLSSRLRHFGDVAGNSGPAEGP